MKKLLLVSFLGIILLSTFYSIWRWRANISKQKGITEKLVYKSKLLAHEQQSLNAGFIPTDTLAQLTEENEQHYTLKKMNEVYPSGENYSSQLVLDKINGFKSKIEIDTAEWGEGIYFFWLTGYLQGLDGTNYSTKDSSFFTYPEDYIFADLNNDNIEDMIFQSRGPFVFDSRTFAFFISDSTKNKHNVFWFGGVLTEVSEYSLSVPHYSDKFNGLMVNYIKYGCCALFGWDKYKTDYIFFTEHPDGMENPETIRIINRNTADY